MKIISYPTRVSRSEIQGASAKKYINSLIDKISKCALALLIGLTTITTLTTGATAYPYPRVAGELTTITSTVSPDSVEIIPIEEVNPNYKLNCMQPNLGSLMSTPCKRPQNETSWSCTIL